MYIAGFIYTLLVDNWGKLILEICHAVETFQKLELEKKKCRVHRQTYSGPIIRYHSVTVPVTDEPSSADPEINVDSDTADRYQQPSYKTTV